MWTLVFIAVSYNLKTDYMEPRVEQWYEFDTMYECFAAREALSETLGRGNGYFYPNSQAVCIEVLDPNP